MAMALIEHEVPSRVEHRALTIADVVSVSKGAEQSVMCADENWREVSKHLPAVLRTVWNEGPELDQTRTL
jgi:hypothetical protein